jgi:hypothetical protein
VGMTRKQASDKVRREAPTVAALLDAPTTPQVDATTLRAAWDELVRLADDRRMGAKEAYTILGVLSPNLYLTLQGRVEPAEKLAMGKTYRARDIEALAAERKRARFRVHSNGRTGPSKRKQRTETKTTGTA